MYELSLVIGFTWIALAALSLLMCVYWRRPLSFALALASLIGLVLDFTGGALGAKIVFPLIAFAGTLAIAKDLRPQKPAPVLGKLADAMLLDEVMRKEEAQAKPTAFVLLVRPHTANRSVWLAHDGRGLIQVTPTCPQRAFSGCRVGLMRQPNGEFLVVT
jgi:hypothetical protein